MVKKRPVITDLDHLLRPSLKLPPGLGPYSDASPDSIFLFNPSGIKTPFGLVISYRALIHEAYRSFAERPSLPTMWYRVQHPKWPAAPARWTGVGFIGMALVRSSPETDWQPIVVSHETYFYPDYVVEDPRLYYKADGKLYIYAITVRPECGMAGKNCVYITENEVLLAPDSASISPKPWHTLCENQLLRLAGERQGQGRFVEKNWAPWVWSGRDYITYSLPRYVVYEETSEGCRIVLDKNNAALLEIEKAFRFWTNQSTKPLSFFKISLTTPAVDYRAGGRDVKLAAAHVRANVPFFSYSPDRERRKLNVGLLNVVRKEMAKEPIYASLSALLGELAELYVQDKLFAHPDIYLICLYAFDPATADVLWWSDYFLPMIWKKECKTRIPLAFPSSVVVQADEVHVFYGEGDVRMRSVELPGDYLARMVRPFPTLAEFRILRCEEAVGESCDARTVSRLIEDQFRRPSAGRAPD